MTAATLADQLPGLDALAQMTAAFGHLPGAHISLSPIFPDQLGITLHDDLDAFEQWRTALGIPTDAVIYTPRPHHMNLKAHGKFAGAEVELTGFAPPLPAGGEQE